MTNQLFIHPALRQKPKPQAVNASLAIPPAAKDAVLLEPVFKALQCSVCEDTSVVSTWNLDQAGGYSAGGCWACKGAPVINEPIDTPRATLASECAHQAG